MAGRTRLYATLMLVVVLLSCGGSGVLAQATNGTTSLRPTASVSGNSTSVSATPTSNITSSVSSTTIATISSSAAVSASPSASSPPFLDTRVEGWNGAAGALMILSGLALGLAGVRSRWTSFFLIGFWSAALAVGCIILHFGVDQALKPPSQSTRGLYLFASLASGVLVGGACIIWATGAQYLCGSLGGFAVGMFILALRSDGLIRSEAGKYGLLLGLAAVGFGISTFGRLQHSVVLFGCASVGASLLVLGIDTLTSQNLLQMYAYNIGAGLRRLSHFPLSTAMQIELGVMAAVFLCSLLLQWKFMKVLVTRVKDLKQADLERERKEELQAARNRLSGAELERWEERYGNKRGQKLDEEKQAGETKSADQLLPELNFASAQRPATAPLHSAAPLSSKWASYLSARKVFVDDRQKPKPSVTPRPPVLPSPAEIEERRRSTMASLPLPRPISTSFPSVYPQPRATAPFQPSSSPERSHRPSLPTSNSRGLSQFESSTPTSATNSSSDDNVPLSSAMRDRARGGGAPKPSSTPPQVQPRRQAFDALQPVRRTSSSGVIDRVISPPPPAHERKRSLSLEQGERMPLAMRRESSRVSGINKVDFWRRESLGEPTAVQPQKPKGKHDWLGY